MQKFLLAVSLCVFFAVLGLVARERTAAAGIVLPGASVAPTWSASSSDLLALDGLNARVADMDKALAPVISDSELRGRVIQFTGQQWARVTEGSAALRDEAAARHGLAKGMRCYYDAAVGWVATSS